MESEVALKVAARMAENEIVVEGYSEILTFRSLITYFYDAKDHVNIEMQLDGVGGGAVIAKADVHGERAIFLLFSFYHLIETEGVTNMTKPLGYEVLA